MRENKTILKSFISIISNTFGKVKKKIYVRIETRHVKTCQNAKQACKAFFFVHAH